LFEFDNKFELVKQVFPKLSY